MSDDPRILVRARGSVISVALSVVTIALTIMALEIVLRAWFPFAVTPTGDRRARNARWYGWGYDPHQTITVRDPDTEQVFSSPANGGGWRDLDHRDDSEHRYRILALGDSTTFGMIVPAERTWTRLLEARLRLEGFDAEVINMSYPGWGTDQELEALIREGLALHPDLVIMQFTLNDLIDNAYFVSGDRTLKPFYYELDGGDGLVRRRNPYFGSVAGATWRERAHAIIGRSELLKRVYAGYVLYRWRTRSPYTVTASQLTQLRTVLGRGASNASIDYLARRAGGTIDRADIVAAAALAARDDAVPLFLRIFENRPFTALWIPLQYRPPPPDPASFEWRLLFALLREAHVRATGQGAALALLSEQDVGLYRWERKWFRLAPKADARRAYLAPTALLKEFAAAENIGFVENVEPCTRARNDSHPNARGYVAMAANVYRYLLREHAAALGGVRGLR
jgi:lysophospholipase L1-like esterase